MASIASAAPPSLRLQILHHALPLLPRYSFTRQSLLESLPSLDPSHEHYKSDLPQSVIDTLFGPGHAGPSQALVGAWEDEGLGRMNGRTTRERLKSRLRYSSEIGEHLVEAYALLSSPGSSTSIPLPRALSPILSQMKIPPLYSPPGPSSSPFTSSSSPSNGSNPAQELATILRSTSHRLPLLAFNPVGSLSYAWRVADAAIKVDEKAMGVKKGIMDEPIGQGPEWYASRISLMAAYLAAESRLLQPMPEGVSTAPNPYLSAAEANLDDHLDRHESVSNAISHGEDGLGQAMTYFGHIGRSALSLIKSRGF